MKCWYCCFCRVLSVEKGNESDAMKRAALKSSSCDKTSRTRDDRRAAKTWANDEWHKNDKDERQAQMGQTHFSFHWQKLNEKVALWRNAVDGKSKRERGRTERMTKGKTWQVFIRATHTHTRTEVSINLMMISFVLYFCRSLCLLDATACRSESPDESEKKKWKHKLSPWRENKPPYII